MSGRNPNDDSKEFRNKFEKMEAKLKEYMVETDQLKNKVVRQENDLNRYMAKTDELEKSRNKLYIGQLCANVMEAIYWEVLPVYFKKGNDYKQPHLRYIDKDIEQLCETRDDQKEAQERWTKLQADKIDPDEKKVKKLVEFMENKLKERNIEAHPCPLNEEELQDIASNLPVQDQPLFKKAMQLHFHTLSCHGIE
ncbi:uncharacterized protein LOC116286349 [Actinia tenebrosa]|uniref:Uncharacterized protein LOC116286349 n=1 Tax=Actinia tenebrosa TaxID=6105 RepID=A0A6P8GYT6_ACTTE|nr:uncharacterized protein LOC116286349 [Actinia tenebrosa]XP_031548684.1 uncharacterized protein LOC116286349 [Actinia tenebrosa]XP_031548685.1 uncharacterized protein LOC116286349 [Actinia tenebrosa]